MQQLQQMLLMLQQVLLQQQRTMQQQLSRTALKVAALGKDIGEDGPWNDIPVRRYTFSWVHDSSRPCRTRRTCGTCRGLRGTRICPVSGLLAGGCLPPAGSEDPEDGRDLHCH